MSSGTQPSATAPHSLEPGRPQGDTAVDRRTFLAGFAGTAVLAGMDWQSALAQQGNGAVVNLARVATPTSLTTTSENKIGTLNDGFEPANSHDHSKGSYAIYRGSEDDSTVPEWVQYSWSKPVTLNKIDVYWAIDPPRRDGPPGSGGGRLGAPASYRLLYWSGAEFVTVPNVSGLGLEGDRFNSTSFDQITTDKVRLEVVPSGRQPAGILEWKVFNAGPVPSLPPVVQAGIDRSVVMGGKTYLSGKALWLIPEQPHTAQWARTTGPGTVAFANPLSPVTTATFSAPGDYVLTLTAAGEGEQATSSVHVHAATAPPKKRLDVVYTRSYSIDSPLWNARAKTLIVNWIPHCIAYCERTDIAPNRGDGGLDNFIEAGKANRGEPHGPHKGFVFSNAWVHQTVESMCIALMVDPQGDPETISAQEHMRGTLERWIPLILAAPMPDGYLQTAYILADREAWPERWSPEHRGNHEGYVSGYFIESAINHYTLNDGKDLRMYGQEAR